MLQRLRPALREQGKKLAQVARIQARGLLQTAQQTEEDADALNDAAAAWGLQVVRREGTGPDKCYLWPCNLPTWNIWQRLQTQWRTGPMGGRDGLDYAAVIRYLQEVVRLRPRHFQRVFAELQAMEFAAQDEYDKLAAEARSKQQ